MNLLRGGFFVFGSFKYRESETKDLRLSEHLFHPSHLSPAFPRHTYALNMTELYPDLKDRPIKETICLFDVDGTLTPARNPVSAEMLVLLSKLRHKCAIGFVRLLRCL